MKYTLKTRDLVKGALMAVLVPAVYIIQTSLDAGVLTFNWKQILIASISGLLAYLIKNFFTDDIQVAKNIIAKDRLDNQQL
jgi:hypothetical protein